MTGRKPLLWGSLCTVLLAGAGGVVYHYATEADEQPESPQRGDPAEPGPARAAEAVIDLQLPAGARVRLNGEDRGRQRRLAVRGLAPGRWNRQELTITYAAGISEKHTLLLRPGRRVALARPRPAKDRPELVLQTGHTEGLVRCAWSPTGSRAYTLGADHQLIEWDPATGRQLRVLLRDASAGSFWLPYGVLDISPAGQLLAARDGRPVLLDLRSGKVIREYKGAMKSIFAAAFHPDGKSFAAAGNGKLFLCATSAAGPRQVLGKADRGVATDLAFSKEGDRLLAGGHGSAVVWDLRQGKQLQTFRDKRISSCALSPDGRTVATASDLDKQVGLWDVASGKRVKELAGEGAVLGFQAVRFSPDGTTLAGVGPGPTVCTWDLESGKVVARFLGHTADFVGCLAFSKDGQRLLTGDRDGTALVFHAQSGTLQQRLEGRLAVAQDAAFSADGTAILLAVAGSPMRVAPGRDQRDILLPGHGMTPQSGIFSPDGSHLLTLSRNNQVFLWETATGHRVRSFPTVHPTAGAFSPDGRRVLVGTGDGHAVLWDVATETAVLRLEGHRKRVHSVAISGDGGHALTCSEDGTVLRWNLATGLQQQVYEIHDFDSFFYKEKVPDLKLFPFTGACLSPDGQLVLTIGQGPTLLWDAITGRLRNQLGLTVNEQIAEMQRYARAGKKLPELLGKTFVSAFLAGAAAFSPDETHVATAGSLGTSIVLWNVNTRRPVKVLADLGAAKRFAQVRSLAFSGDGKRLLAGMHNGTAVLWDVATGRPLRTFNLPLAGTGTVDRLTLDGNGAALSPDGRTVLTVAGASPTLWDAADGKMLREFRGRGDRSGVPAFQCAGKLAVVGGPQDRFEVWDLDTCRRTHALANEAKDLDCCWHPTRRQLLTWGKDANVRLRDLQTGKVVRLLRGGPKQRVWTAAFSRDGKWVVATGEDRTVRVWNIKTGRPAVTLAPFAQPVSTVAVANSCTRILTGDAKGNVGLWDGKGRRVWARRAHKALVRALTFGPDDTTALSCSGDGTAILWDLAAGAPLRTFTGHGGMVYSARFSPDGRLIVTAAQDGVRLWELATGLELARLAVLRDSNEVVVVTPDGLFDGSRKGRELVAFRLKESGSVVPLDRLFTDYYQPDLLNEVLRGGHPLPGRALTGQSAPLVRLLLNPDGAPPDRQRAVVDVAVTDRGAGVYGPWLHHNGSRLNLTGTVLRKDGATAVYRFSVKVVPGENRIEARAAAADRKQESEPAVITFDHGGAAAPPRLFVLAVGISRYDALGDLEFAARDADCMADLFETQFAHGFAERHIRRLTGKGQATRLAILKALEAWKEAGPNDTVVLYAACHGRSHGQRYYLIPYEFRPEDPGRPDDDLRRQALSIDDLGDALAKVRALRRVLIFDTCYSGSVVGQAGRQNLFGARGAAERLNHAHGVYSLTATQSNQLAAEHKELRHGVLTYTLLAACGRVDRGPLAGRPVPAPPGGRDVDVLEWFRYAQRHVPGLYRIIARRAHAVALGGEDSPGFALLHVGPGDPTRASPPPPRRIRKDRPSSFRRRTKNEPLANDPGRPGPRGAGGVLPGRLARGPPRHRHGVGLLPGRQDAGFRGRLPGPQRQRQRRG
jgi:WD40 repeat protein